MRKEAKITYTSGYMTLEAALLFPILFSIITLLLYVGFFVYDRCLLESSAYIAALRGSRMQMSDNNEVYDETYLLAKGLVEGRVFGVRDEKISVTVTFDEVKVSYDAQVSMPIGTVLVKILNRNYLKIHVQKQAKRIRTVPIIREFRRIEKMLNQKDGEKG